MPGGGENRDTRGIAGTISGGTPFSLDLNQSGPITPANDAEMPQPGERAKKREGQALPKGNVEKPPGFSVLGSAAAQATRASWSSWANWASSVEPAKAVVEDWPPSMVWVTASK